MKPSGIGDALRVLVNSRQPVFLLGPVGVGKSSVVRQLAEALSVPLQDVRALLLDPVRPARFALPGNRRSLQMGHTRFLAAAGIRHSLPRRTQRRAGNGAGQLLPTGAGPQAGRIHPARGLGHYRRRQPRLGPCRDHSNADPPCGTASCTWNSRPTPRNGPSGRSRRGFFRR